mmetsp:Transcript_43968/g.75983  ORF Transcript_43968/g.75983 Transcript_43968/m.75983 type:complete len:89 (+) Transcript_43968:1311-1577(+)
MTTMLAAARFSLLLFFRKRNFFVFTRYTLAEFFFFCRCRPPSTNNFFTFIVTLCTVSSHREGTPLSPFTNDIAQLLPARGHTDYLIEC